MLRFISRIGFFVISISVQSQNLTVYMSEMDVETTLDQIVSVIKQNENLVFFETVAHDVLAKERGLDLAPTRSVLFEEPVLTTALIKCQATAALDLPLEILVWEEHEEVYVGFIDPKYMIRRFMISDCDETIRALSSVLTRVCVKGLKPN
ncbi:MAG: DUF302 domain-containing protein [Cyclobacteriaceae bacterium]